MRKRVWISGSETLFRPFHVFNFHWLLHGNGRGQLKEFEFSSLREFDFSSLSVSSISVRFLWVRFKFTLREFNFSSLSASSISVRFLWVQIQFAFCEFKFSSLSVSSNSVRFLWIRIQFTPWVRFQFTLCVFDFSSLSVNLISVRSQFTLVLFQFFFGSLWVLSICSISSTSFQKGSFEFRLQSSFQTKCSAVPFFFFFFLNWTVVFEFSLKKALWTFVGSRGWFQSIDLWEMGPACPRPLLEKRWTIGLSLASTVFQVISGHSTSTSLLTCIGPFSVIRQKKNMADHE